MNNVSAAYKSNMIFSDTLLVAILSAFAYIVAYSYELGYLKYYNIPSEFIEISTVRIISTALILFGLFTIIGFIYSPLLEFLTAKDPFVRLAGKYILLIPMYIIFLWLSGFDKTARYVIVIILCGSFVKDFLLPILTKKDIKGVFNKIAHNYEQSENKKPEEGPFLLDRIYRTIGPHNFMLLVFGIACTFISYGIGRDTAINKTQFQVTKGTNRIIILKQSGSSLLGVTIDGNKMIQNDVYIIDKSSLKEYGSLSIENVGPIKPNPVMQKK